MEILIAVLCGINLAVLIYMLEVLKEACHILYCLGKKNKLIRGNYIIDPDKIK